MGVMSQEEINSTLFDEVQKQRQEIRKLREALGEIDNLVENKMWNEGLEEELQIIAQKALEC